MWRIKEKILDVELIKMYEKYWKCRIIINTKTENSRILWKEKYMWGKFRR